MLQTHYKVYLAFENSACREYITEKLWYNALQHDTVPVVLGPTREHYDKMAPAESFIHVEDFQSPRHLARHLRRLDKDFRLYYKYRKWTLHWSVTSEIVVKPKRSEMWCSLCSALHDDRLPPSVTGQLDQWWSRDVQCGPSNTRPRL